jgi:segregation and condensation protein B
MRTLLEREWIKIVGQREAPGRPAIYGTTKAFLDYFGVRSLDQLPPLDEIREMIEPVIEAEKAAAEAAANAASGDKDTPDPEADRSAEKTATVGQSHEDASTMSAEQPSVATEADSGAGQQAAAPTQDAQRGI